ncbi:hypothetical protein BB65665_16248 [Bacillus sp. 916]|nr:hypothetical protein BB65665_16248 [Bacillus sp. 916]
MIAVCCESVFEVIQSAHQLAALVRWLRQFLIISKHFYKKRFGL